ncbi:DUF2306 domain-containing protein [Pseudoroseomonas cervicalis]|uniref:DUF2306 domain-containing protein n=1 Tax=Pseudoroseomonas cervicalis ATCC 49957 TaxID=525371 RepID=D5RJB6_9PROT|nr:DUF2306 domain-containing protein [Pseudoroseomonas cervicalis]EFH12614.1 hypothetical protein HMPREF0731_1176 [Pseudoroseomonas cervicalis ATCC 49957]
MSLAPLLAAPLVVQAHVAAALGAFLLGLLQLSRRKGGAPHRHLGRSWALLMLVTALTSFGITGVAAPGRYSWIHLLSLLVLVTVPMAVFAALAGRITTHRRAMLALFLLALVVTGGFTLLPGRLMHQMVFGTP